MAGHAADPDNAFAALTDRVGRAGIRTAVVHPVDVLSLSGAMAGYEAGLIVPVLIGPAARIAEAAKAAGIDLSGIEIVDTPHSHAAASEAVKLAASGNVSALMKGALATSELMGACVATSGGLRTERRMSHIFVMEAPAWPTWLLISDGGLNIAPDLMTKRWIVQNAIDLARAIGIDKPRTAILSATELVDPHIPSTIDAAALCKMADRGQISGGPIDGPLAFDLAISMASVETKGLISLVAGKADILIVPGIEAGNMLAKQLDYLAGAAAAGLVLGAKVPIILTSRSDGVRERVASCALAAAYLHWIEAVK
ncbi:MAG: phosphate acetyltransferase [Hyphomonas sp. BRH_c22]|uniref:bifunctional enoyl-CoA hydratase/phosphate acetyltransferase n=1 Tax=Hyphomonas sp. BRH_c22 TaxID=1629710 RepID=UPI0005F0C802|nr:bifunctional enoyl-CoA hydratase/phosphate acetyltransferase [Hyphomonas sp. BRH_c22]KJS35362.1 MAG: phosphate acetyltransferase [Hyphomonas sp. BRH_c22]